MALPQSAAEIEALEAMKALKFSQDLGNLEVVLEDAKRNNATMKMEIRTLSFPADSPPPLPVIVAAKLAGLALPIDTSLPPNSAPTLLFSDGYSFFFFFDKDLFFLPKA
nr:hypothetical protein CFP56_77476 [Quercus suber]